MSNFRSDLNMPIKQAEYSEDECPDIHSSSQEYESRFSGSVGEYLLEVQSNVLADFLGKYPAAQLLDIGGGHNQVARVALALGLGVTVHGTHPSCSRALQDLIDLGAIQFIIAPMSKLPVEDKSFQVVTVFRMLTHFARWQELVAEVCRISADSVVIEFPPRRGFNLLYGYLFKLKKRVEGNTRTFRVFSRGELEAEFERYGFIPSCVKAQFFAPIVFHRVLKWSRLSRFLEKTFSRMSLTKLYGGPIMAEFKRRETIGDRALDRLF